jgi:four helix bundle protein
VIISNFISKLTDSDAENSETQTCLRFAFASDYMSREDYDYSMLKSKEVGKLINYLINNPDKFGCKM